jgi:hypothetical protein
MRAETRIRTAEACARRGVVETVASAPQTGHSQSAPTTLRGVETSRIDCRSDSSKLLPSVFQTLFTETSRSPDTLSPFTHTQFGYMFQFSCGRIARVRCSVGTARAVVICRCSTMEEDNGTNPREWDYNRPCRRSSRIKGSPDMSASTDSTCPPQILKCSMACSLVSARE